MVRVTLQLFLLCWVPGMVDMCKSPLTEKFPFPHSSLPYGSVRSKLHWFSRLDALGPHLSSVVAKCWGNSCGTLRRQGKTSCYEIPPNCGVLHLAWGFLQDCLCLSYLSRCCPSRGGTIQLILRSFSEEMVPYIALDVLCSWRS